MPYAAPTQRAVSQLHFKWMHLCMPLAGGAHAPPPHTHLQVVPQPLLIQLHHTLRANAAGVAPEPAADIVLHGKQCVCSKARQQCDAVIIRPTRSAPSLTLRQKGERRRREGIRNLCA
eukprot:scaffold116036_cov20-Tisochrysis_lutea.AAC.2